MTNISINRKYVEIKIENIKSRLISLNYAKPDIIMDVFDEFIIFKGLNDFNYSNIYYRTEDDTYKLF
ncbi:TPA: hypothetical protein I9092_003169 [Clostridium perfringens]|uniref:Uncharacterized protein n=1 Tax=Clostridium perfringens TaxID=1502 RepID=F8UNJ1_CLOPF|nr:MULTISPECIES: hypothetical protein [Clostridium]AEJ34199.1 conserved hypothetical protein [Clostridium perfringens]AEP95038.1 hypothetical protein pNetB_00062 [Clostridium perfringens]AFV15067.1 hypothetical protein pNetB-NE10_61 [Clostridium perfringens]AQW28388.1 hypothetical protein BXT94_16760 [Clostridium perfringens]AWS27150.1 hypothetical protein CYK96_16135 [Clostridium perfringens]